MVANAANGDSVTLSLDDLNTLIEQKVAEKLAASEATHAAELAAAMARVPQNAIPLYSGGPSVNNIRRSWSLVEQEHARAGEDLEHWHDG